MDLSQVITEGKAIIESATFQRDPVLAHPREYEMYFGKRTGVTVQEYAEMVARARTPIGMVGGRPVYPIMGGAVDGPDDEDGDDDADDDGATKAIEEARTAAREPLIRKLLARRSRATAGLRRPRPGVGQALC